LVISVSVCDIERLIYKLDVLYVRLNTVVATAESLFKLIIPGIIRDLKECGCEFHSMRVDNETREVRMYFSFNNNKTCVCIVIETKRTIENNIIELKSHYYIQGASCDFRLLG
jgi:hypothetical protein